jgi:glycosyltransferase involved in cell wall biosynthesis
VKVTGDLRVAYVNQPLDSLFPPRQNSIGLWTYWVAPFVAQKLDVGVYGRRADYHKNGHQQDPVRYHFYPIIPHKILHSVSKFFVLDGGGALPDYATRPYYVEYILQVAQSVRRNQYGIVHIHNFTQFVPIIRRFNPQTKIILHMHCEWLSQLDYASMEKRISQTDLVLGSSNHITNLVKERFPQFQDRCFTLYNGVDASLFQPNGVGDHQRSDAPPRILFVGRVSPEKGVHDLIRAFLQVLKHHPDAQLDIVGPVGAMPLSFLVGVSDDPVVQSLTEWYRSNYHTLLQEIIPQEYSQNILFHGGVNQAELVRFYQAADILVNPSYSESFGMSLVEAMACEKPVIATRAGGMVEIVEQGKLGILVERGDVDALAEGIFGLLADPNRRSLLGMKGRKRVLEMFDWPQIARQAVNYYEGQF